MKIVFFGTAPFGLPTLEAIRRSRHELLAVVTGPDKPQGRGLTSSPTPVGEWAERIEFEPVLKPENLDSPELVQELRAIPADVYVVVAYRILPEPVFTIPKYAFNLHASLLPKYRGAAPIQRAIMAGERHTGVTTFMLKKAVDTGDVICRKETQIDSEENAGELAERLAVLGADAVQATLDLLEIGKFQLQRQDDSEASPAPKIKPPDLNLHFNLPAERVVNWVRALAPSPGVGVRYQGRNVKILKLRPSEGGCGGEPPGTILAADPKQGVHIATSDRPVEVVTMQPEGKRPQTGAEFVRGYRVKPGDRFEPLA